jgi:hypothetical protein
VAVEAAIAATGAKISVKCLTVKAATPQDAFPIVKKSLPVAFGPRFRGTFQVDHRSALLREGDSL